MIYQIRALTVLTAVILVAGCGTFTNMSVIHHRLKVSEHECTTANGAIRDFEFRVASFNEDGSIQLTIDEAESGVRLLEDEWVDLPLLKGLILRRVRLIKSHATHGHVEIEYEQGVESGPPILRHL